MMDEGKAEIYKYIRDQNDKYLAGRESLISRYGNIRLLAGLLLTVFSISIGVVAKSIEGAKSLPQRIVAALPLLFFAVALYYVTKALLAIPGLVGNITTNIPIADETLMEFFKEDKIDADQLLEVLSHNYLHALKENIKENDAAVKTLKKCADLIRTGFFATIAFLAITLLTSIAVLWRFSFS